MVRRSPFSHRMCVLAASLIVSLATAREPDVRLPDIGSSAAAILSPQDLHDYGAEMLQEMRAYGMVLDDALLTDYINALGFKLVAASDHPDMSFDFFIVRDPQINAFAAPGGFVAANAGLITAMQSEDELAGVMAHEISHVEQQHILRAFEDTKKMSIPIMLGMLGVMIAASHSRDDTAAAAMMTGTSLIQQRQINFTRSEEAEADRVGIDTLARASFDPSAMAGAFQTLQKVMRVNGVDVPEFLLDHPLDTKRIADAKARAAQLGCPSTPRLAATHTTLLSGALDLRVPARGVAEAAALPLDDASANAASAAAVTSIGATPADGKTLPPVSVTACFRHPETAGYFELMRERARVLSAQSMPAMRGYYADNLRDDPAFDTPANRYGYALALIETRQPTLAAKELKKLSDNQPSSPVFGLALAHAEDLGGDKAGALKRFEQLSGDFPGNRAVTLTYSDALLAKGELKSARRALELLRPMVERHADDPDLQKSYGRANELAGDKIRAAEAYAEAAFLTGHAEDALNQLKRLSKESDLTYYQRSRIDARITQLTPTVLAMRKRDAPTPDSIAPAFSCCRAR
ncbi:MAG: M48 family metalloprotease [Dokdonella sp.]|uniref:beta-barrel assembly-enhancing protease n=1 Tax=Dokdonella sp. TaxID=2291710 RepID=UPI003265B5DE